MGLYERNAQRDAEIRSLGEKLQKAKAVSNVHATEYRLRTQLNIEPVHSEPRRNVHSGSYQGGESYDIPVIPS